MGKTKPGALYVGDGRRYVDSQALRNIAHTHEIVHERDGGWRILGEGGAVACSIISGRQPLPAQHGALYEVSAGPGVLVSMARAWALHGQIQVHETPADWHPAVAAPCGGCGSTCACGPCQHKHAHAEPAAVPAKQDPHGG